MLNHNKQIVVSGDSVLEILKDVEFIMISLKNIARHYYDNVENEEDIDPVAYALETTKFIDENHIVHRLAKMRSILSERFDRELNDEELAEVELMMESLVVWRKPGL
jgi:hypothetical protein